MAPGWRAGRRVGLAVGFGWFLGTLVAACGVEGVPSPFGPAAGGGGAGGEAGARGDGELMLDVDGGTPVDPTLGGPCEDDGQCDDRVSCTRDRCDQALGRCRFEPDDASCANGIYCDGAERCDQRAGCVQGAVVSCSDNATCTIDTCIEQTQSCRHEPRDADGDADPTRNCGGKDCDDTNPRVSSRATEVCGNQRDDNCDERVDETDCADPEFDTCASALEVTAAGYYDLDLTATALNYPTSCASEVQGFRDAVLSILVPDGGPFDVDVTAKLDSGKLSLGSADSCGDGASTRCESSFETPRGGSVARLILRGRAAGKLPIYVSADSEGTAQVQVVLRPAEPQRGELCEDAAALLPGGAPVLLRLHGVRDLASECKPLTSGGFVTFTLEAASDVTLIAEALNDLGLPVLSLVDEKCKRELTCRKSQPGRLFVRNLAPGTYRALVGGTGPDDVSVRLETQAVSERPPGEGCADAQPLVSGVEQLVDLSIHEDAVQPGCLVGAPDSTFEFRLAAQADVALVGRFSAGDRGAVSIANRTCAASSVCSVGSLSVRAVRYGVPAGTYRAVIESARGNPVGLSWFERPPVAEIAVPFADDCDGLVTIPEWGGRFVGNTANAFPDFSAGCDRGGQEPGGAPDQMLKLRLTQPRRVILDMRGSGFATMLSVRQGRSCPGVELGRACARAVDAPPSAESASRWIPSYLDLDLEAGDYFVQIDGYDGAFGPWRLDVFTAPR